MAASGADERRPGRPPLTGGPRPATKVPDTALGRTPGGLARRPRRAAAAGGARAASPVDDRALVESLGRYVPGGSSSEPPPAASGSAGGSPDDAAPHDGAPEPAAAPDEGLTHRVPGAQLPQAGLVPLRGPGGGDLVPPPPIGEYPRTTDGVPPPVGGARRANHVRQLLASFTAGVERGLAEARSQPAHAPVTGPGSANGNGHAARPG